MKDVFTPKKIMNQKTYQKRKALGVCVYCGSPKEEGRGSKCMCASCSEKQRAYKDETRKFLKNIGLCPKCGKNSLWGNEKMCLECSATAYEENRRNREKRNAYAKEYYKKSMEELKKLGLCRSCRKRNVEKGHTYCSTCLAKKRERSHGKVDIPRNERPSYGLCYICGRSLNGNKKICPQCSEKMTKNLPKMGDNIYWRRQNRLLGGAESCKSELS